MSQPTGAGTKKTPPAKAGLNPWQKAGIRFLAAYAGLVLIQWLRLLAVQSDLDGWKGRLAWAGPLAVIGLALLAAGCFRAANRWLRVSLACLWAYSSGFLLLLAVDFSRPPPCCFDSYGSLVFIGMIMMSPLLMTASASWLAGWLAAGPAETGQDGFGSGARLLGQLLAGAGLGIGGAIGLPLGWLAWADSAGQYLTQGGAANDWRIGLGYAALLLAGAGLASWRIGRLRPNEDGRISRQ